MKKLVIFVDGSSQGNPGPAGIGYVIETPNGQEIDSASMYIGRTTNNIAEYTALVEGLKRARELGADEIIVKTDSELLYKQITGQFKVRNKKIHELYLKAMKEVGSFKNVKLQKIPREENKADILARKKGKI